MDKPALYSRRPILSAPLRWRVAFAGLCLLLAVIDRWAPWQLTIGPSLLMLLITLVVLIYPMMEGADPRVMEPGRPLLAKAIAILCLIGLLATFVTRVMTSDFSSHDGFHPFLLGVLLSGPPVLRQRDGAETRAPHESQ